MSTRTHFYSITSIEPLRASVASQDRSIADAAREQYKAEQRKEYGKNGIDEESLEKFQGYVDSMVMCSSPPKKEPGCWNYVMQQLTRHYGLEPEDSYSFNEGWKHYQAWVWFRKLVGKQLSDASLLSLGYLENGRPLKGMSVEHDGCVFAWLTPEEVAELHQALSALEPVADEDMQEFQETLVETLGEIRESGKALLMVAH
jgi:hypothetical protein